MTTTLYICRSNASAPLYVGITDSVPKRLSDHMKRDWWREVAWVETREFDTRAGAAEAEIEAIRSMSPKYNITHNGTAVKWTNEKYLPIQRTDGPDYVSLAEASREFGVSVKTLRRYISAGRITGYRFGPRMLRVDRTEIRAFMRPLATAALSKG